MAWSTMPNDSVSGYVSGQPAPNFLVNRHINKSRADAVAARCRRSTTPGSRADDPEMSGQSHTLSAKLLRKIRHQKTGFYGSQRGSLCRELLSISLSN
jgi:hypothetical protein